MGDDAVGTAADSKCIDSCSYLAAVPRATVDTGDRYDSPLSLARLCTLTGMHR